MTDKTMPMGAAGAPPRTVPLPAGAPKPMSQAAQLAANPKPGAEPPAELYPLPPEEEDEGYRVHRELKVGERMNFQHHPLALKDRHLRQHALLSGRPNGGIELLTESLLAQQTRHGRGWVYFDTTGNYLLRDRLAALAQAEGRGDEFLVLAPYTHRNSFRYDVFRYGNIEQRALRALQALPAKRKDPHGAFVRAQALKILRHVLGKALDARVTLNSLVDWLSGLTGEELLENLVLPAVAVANDVAKAKSETLLLGVKDELIQAYTKLDMDSFDKFLTAENPETSFQDVLSHNKMCYVMLPFTGADANAKLLRVARMMLLDFLDAMPVRAAIPRRLRAPLLAVLANAPAYAMPLSDLVQPILDNHSFDRAFRYDVSLMPTTNNWSKLRHVDELLWLNWLPKMYTRIEFAVENDPTWFYGSADFHISMNNGDENCYGYLAREFMLPAAAQYERPVPDF
ncbi:hypothetical protein KTD31_03050 [Burkholderia multivorans]|uniref:hypothetical protein n=1 Tax=Burkholderia multivorans TaxID=87883 RepID=UPI001C238E3B|nr:hypothetical protein [Burkholderia multivorans]MBU9200330.1 hypothetical protein [Burkholderia multivorans]MDN8078544.1 hypothetical protein [Burkholderia multivorans]